jgi:mercuric ion transport protein
MSRDTTRNASLGGAVAAAIAASACCVGPLLFALLGLGGAGALVALEPYRPLFTAVTVLLLGIGWYLTYRRPVAHPTSAAQTSPVPHNAVDEDCGCEMPRTNKTGKRLLWVATAVAGVALAFPYITPFLF